MTSKRAVCVLTLLFVALAGCEEDKPSSSSPTRAKAAKAKAKTGAKTGTKTGAKPNATASEKPTASASVGPADKSKAPTQLARGLGLSKVIALHDDYVYWVVRPGANCRDTAGDCSSASDGSIWRVPKKGGVPKEVVASLYNVTSLAFSDKDVLWTMCGSVDYVQRCQVTSAPQQGGKRNVHFDAGPELVENVVWAKGRAIWAEPSQKRLQQANGESEPAIFAAAGDVTDAVVHGDTVFWTAGRGVAASGSVHKASVAEAKPLELAAKRRSPRHIATDGEHVYWVEAGQTDAGKPEQVVMRVGLDGGEPKRVVGELSYVDDIHIGGDRVLFATTEAVAWAPKDGGRARELVGKLSSPHGPIADDTHAYWISDDKVWRIELPE